MCGIFGFVAATERDSSSVLAGLRYLEYRGYDSWGIAIARDDGVVCEKAVGAIADAHTHLPGALAALGHTRWATHGGVTEANAHPHVDCHGRFALIHNGIVENYRELGARLRDSHRFLSQTDTEVLVHLLEECLESEGDLSQALLSVFRQVEGLSAVAVLDSESGQIAAAKNGSPLVIGRAEDAVYVASDPIAVLDYTRDVTFLEDGQGVVLSAHGVRVVDIASGRELTPKVRRISWDTHRAGLDGHAHFMEKEINEQPRVLREIAQRGGEAVDALADAIESATQVFLIGCGTAYHAALSARYMLAEIAGRSSIPSPASEMAVLLPMIGPGSLVVAFSQSGETIDVLEAVRDVRARGACVAAVTNAEGSTLHRFADSSVLLESGPERCVLATKSYTAKLAVMYLSACALAGKLSCGVDHVRQSSLAVQALLDRERESGCIRDFAYRIADHQHLFVLGRGRNYPLALEAALKIKEVSYMHAEGFASGELKHGVIALITNGTPCIMLAPDGDSRREVLAASAEVQARGALTLGLSPRAEAEFGMTLPVTGSPVAPYEIAATTQLLAYELALIRGCDPDKPRNLAKSVTVK